LASSGQHSLETGRVGASEIALVIRRWHAHGRGWQGHGSRATRWRDSTGHCGRWRRFERHDSGSNTFHGL